MRRSLIGALIFVTSLVCLGGRAAACSAGPFEPSELTQLLVLGRVRAVDIGAPALLGIGKDGAPVTGGFREAIVTLDVVRTYRGQRLPEVTFVDRTSASVVRDPRSGRDVLEWAGASGACGTIDDDPIGKYVLIALAHGDDGRWHANRLYGAIYTNDIDDAAYRWLLYRHDVVLPYLALPGLAEIAPAAVLLP